MLACIIDFLFSFLFNTSYVYNASPYVFALYIYIYKSKQVLTRIINFVYSYICITGEKISNAYIYICTVNFLSSYIYITVEKINNASQYLFALHAIL